MRSALLPSTLLSVALAACSAAPLVSPAPLASAPSAEGVAAPQPDVLAATPRAAEPPPSAPARQDEQAAYTTPLLDEAELLHAIESACAAALVARRPILLEFSAPWCADCVVLEQMKQVAPLAAELEHWQLLPINVGSGEEHPALMRDFQVRAIAKLVVLAPSTCAAPISRWRRGASRTLDGLRKRGDDASPELVAWLARARAGAARP